MTTVPPPASAAPVDHRIRFVLEFARGLQTCGAAAHRLENALDTCARHLGIEGQFFATPTSVFCAFGPLPAQHVHLLRINAGGVDLSRLTELYEVWGMVLAGRLQARDAAARVRGILAPGPPAPLWWWLACHTGASATAACFLAGGMVEIGLAAALGFLVGLGMLLRHRLDRVIEPLLAFVCAVVVTLVAAHVPVGRESTIIAGIIVLVPGFTLTIAIAELAHGHLAAGTARLMGAAVTFLLLTVGVAVGVRFSAHLAPVLLPSPVGVAPPWTWLAISVVGAALCFTFLFRARRRDAGFVVATCAIAVAGAQVGVAWLGPELGMFVGALLVGTMSNLLARVRGTPAAVTGAPGLMVLVPGSLGLRSLASLVDSETLVGIKSAFSVLLVACSLVTGLLVANFLVRTHRDV